MPLGGTPGWDAPEKLLSTRGDRSEVPAWFAADCPYVPVDAAADAFGAAVTLLDVLRNTGEGGKGGEGARSAAGARGYEWGLRQRGRPGCSTVAHTHMSAHLRHTHATHSSSPLPPPAHPSPCPFPPFPFLAPTEHCPVLAVMGAVLEATRQEADPARRPKPALLLAVWEALAGADLSCPRSVRALCQEASARNSGEPAAWIWGVVAATVQQQGASEEKEGADGTEEGVEEEGEDAEEGGEAQVGGEAEEGGSASRPRGEFGRPGQRHALRPPSGAHAPPGGSAQQREGGAWGPGQRPAAGGTL